MVSEDEVRRVAALARLSIDPSRLPGLVAQLNGILGHMEVLANVESGDGKWDVGETGSATPMRSDESDSPVRLVDSRESFAPLMRDGFFLVPRLTTHEDHGDRSP